MRQLRALQALAETSHKPSKGIGKMLLKLEDEVETACEAVDEIRKQIQSSVITDYLKAEGFPATEAKGVKDAVEAAYQAMRKLEGEMLDLIQAVGMHEHPMDD